MLSRKCFLLTLTMLLIFFSGLVTAQEKPAVKPEDLVGDWELTVEAGEMVITLKLTLALENGVLGGKISEAYGTFAEMPVADLKVEDCSLSFNLTVPSPPDGMTRTWTFELQASGEDLSGLVYNNDVQVSVPVRGKKLSG
ncbi:MAG: hypothetical protein QME85_01725 [Candidatus Saccharicenans sp.]|nr:hypothetical protein [Candidatus Saccharicenans sp.]